MGRSLPWLEGTDRKVSETLSLVHFFCYWQLPDAFSSGQRMQWNTICLSMKSFAANTIWPLQVYSWHAVFVFNFLLTVTVCLHFSHRDTCTVILCDILVSACVCTCSFEKQYVGLFFSRLVCFELFLFYLMLENDCERTEQESEVWHGSCSYLKWIKGVKIKPPYCWWQGLMWIGSGRCWKRFPSDCDGL